MKNLNLFQKACLLIFICASNIFVSHAQIARCKGKYFGNIIQSSVPSNYAGLWNQTTSENGSKWGSIENTRGQYDWASSDVAYNQAKNSGGLFKFHTFVWGAQAPSWVNTASVSTIQAAVPQFINAAAAHYSPMGGLKMIDVVNEPVNTPMTANYRAALTAGYRAEPANQGDLNNPYGWVIWPFQLARRAFPSATLLINEYNVEMNWNNCRAPYIAMVNAVKNAPNLTTGQRNLIDGVGLQAHGIDNLTAANFKACIDEIWTKTGVAIHITEFDQAANPNETKQRDVFSSLIPVAWEHPNVAGITLWGYIQGTTWIRGNNATGPSGTDSGIMYANGTDRPAMSWLRNYMAGRPSLSCCPAPAPFASCPATSRSFTIRARGTATGAQLQLRINNVVINTFNLTTAFANYSISSTARGTVRLQVVNDATNRDVEVDYLQVNSTVLQAEAQPINTAFYSNNRCGGGGSSQMMHCNGYIEFLGAGSRISAEDAELPLNAERKSNEIRVYPNPVIRGKMEVSFELEATQQIDLNMYSNTGRLAKKIAEGEYKAGLHKFTVDCANLPKANYIIYLKKAKGQPTSKTVIVTQ